MERGGSGKRIKICILLILLLACVAASAYIYKLSRTAENTDTSAQSNDKAAVQTEETGLKEKLRLLFRECREMNDGNTLPLHIGVYPRQSENIRNLLVNAGGFMKGVGDLLVQNAVNPEGAGIKLACYSGSNVQKAVLDIGKAFNVKFKPWQTEKIARGFARAGKVMDVLGVALDIGLQIKDDYDAEAQRRELKKFQNNVRAEFFNFAGELVDFGRGFIEEPGWRGETALLKSLLPLFLRPPTMAATSPFSTSVTTIAASGSSEDQGRSRPPPAPL